MSDQRRPPPKGFDENPEWTAKDFARARSATEVHGPEIASHLVAKKRGRPAKAPEDRKQQVTLRLSPDVIAQLRATGDGWQTRVDNILRKGLGLGAVERPHPSAAVEASRATSRRLRAPLPKAAKDRT